MMAERHIWVGRLGRRRRWWWEGEGGHLDYVLDAAAQAAIYADAFDHRENPLVSSLLQKM